jgi:hypothetical protein
MIELMFLAIEVHVCNPSKMSEVSEATLDSVLDVVTSLKAVRFDIFPLQSLY